MEFLLGILAGTLSGLLIVKRMGQKTAISRTASTRRLARTRPRSTLKQAKTRGTRPSSILRLRPRAKPVETVRVEPTVTALAANISSCPACGLQAPDALMAEHFLGSPSHESWTPESAQAMVENALFHESQPLSAEEEAKNSVRSLLQMLVPPRAFGRRHQQRTVNPLSRLVQTIGEAQSALVQPLKRPR